MMSYSNHVADPLTDEMRENLEIQWASHSSDNFEYLEKFRREDRFADVYLASGECFISAHRNVLAAASAFFDRLFSRIEAQGFISSPKTIITLDSDADVMSAVVDFMYSGEAVINSLQLDDFMRLASRLEIRGLKQGSNHPVESTRSFGKRKLLIKGQEIEPSPSRRSVRKRPILDYSEVPETGRRGRREKKNEDPDFVASRPSRASETGRSSSFGASESIGEIKMEDFSADVDAIEDAAFGNEASQEDVDYSDPPQTFEIITTQKNNECLVLGGYQYQTDKLLRSGVSSWRCSQHRMMQCKGRIQLDPTRTRVLTRDPGHSHPPDYERITAKKLVFALKRAVAESPGSIQSKDAIQNFIMESGIPGDALAKLPSAESLKRKIQRFAKKQEEKKNDHNEAESSEDSFLM
ncbi:unnamed protein product [Notodromas monacha]|uniref:BTB domain-containing protein n=1 Tax=Notodromas monacha TaxID=399045 RepID=A0A7R9BIH8_9CRUS|nr:unnamed protein product [Notodromas monacha]CAG0915252.1 unnamed protein product [Notodromas monacha]